MPESAEGAQMSPEQETEPDKEQEEPEEELDFEIKLGTRRDAASDDEGEEADEVDAGDAHGSEEGEGFVTGEEEEDDDEGEEDDEADEEEDDDEEETDYCEPVKDKDDLEEGELLPESAGVDARKSAEDEQAALKQHPKRKGGKAAAADDDDADDDGVSDDSAGSDAASVSDSHAESLDVTSSDRSEAQWRCDVPSKPNNTVDEYTVIGWDGTNPYCASLDGKTCWAEKSNNCQRKLRQLRYWMETFPGLSGAPPGQQPPPQQQEAGAVRPPVLVCGRAMKAITGKTGYEDRNHW
eukprot:gene2418-2722_t